ncbi:MAG TPA: hypothetical protein VM183_06695 [Burkholderiales bacterium]|nr:hypothetical protein [Burkholderiales bacterium]
MANGTSVAVLRRAMLVTGGVRPLCALLGVSVDQLEAWLDGLPVPRAELFKAIDIVLADHDAWMAQDRRAEARALNLKPVRAARRLRA